MQKLRRMWMLLLSLLLAGTLVGCSAPTAAMDLIIQARQGLALSRQAHLDQHEQLMRLLGSQKTQLDDAFDNDARLVEAGAITDPQGQPVAMSAEWAISARRGYSAACDAISRQIQQANLAHTQDLDNIQAVDEAMDLAGLLIIQQYSVAQNLKNQLIQAHRRIIND